MTNFRDTKTDAAAGRVGDRLRADPRFIASLEAAWLSVPANPRPHIALECTETVWRWIALCHRPRNDQFVEDISRIATDANVAPEKLTNFVVIAINAERFVSAPAETHDESVNLLAARERNEDDKK